MAASNYFLEKKEKQCDLVKQLVQETLEVKIGDESYDAAVNFGVDYLAASSFLETNPSEVELDCNNLLERLRWQARLKQSDEIEKLVNSLLQNKQRRVNYDMVRFLLLMARNPANLDFSTLQLEEPVQHSQQQMENEISYEKCCEDRGIKTVEEDEDLQEEMQSYDDTDEGNSLSVWSDDEMQSEFNQQEDLSITPYQGGSQWEDWKGFVLRNGHAQWHPLSCTPIHPQTPGFTPQSSNFGTNLRFEPDEEENEVPCWGEGKITEIDLTLQALKALQGISGNVFNIQHDRLIVNQNCLNCLSKPKFVGGKGCLSGLLKCFAEGGNCSKQLKHFINDINEGNKHTAIMVALCSAIHQRLHKCWEQIEQLVETVMRIKINSQQGDLEEEDRGAGCLPWALLISKPVIQQLKLLQKISSDIQQIYFDNNSSSNESQNLSSILNYFYDNLCRLKISGVLYENQFWFVFRFFLALLKPVIDQIQVWIENGIFHDPTDSFFLEIDNFVVENAKNSYFNQNLSMILDDSQHEFWEKCCRLRLLQIPKFFKSDFLGQVLHAGKAQIVLKSVEEFDNSFVQKQYSYFSNSKYKENFKIFSNFENPGFVQESQTREFFAQNNENFYNQSNQLYDDFEKALLSEQNSFFQDNVLQSENPFGNCQENAQLYENQVNPQIDEIQSQDDGNNNKQDSFFDEVLFGFEQYKNSEQDMRQKKRCKSKNSKEQEYIVQESEDGEGLQKDQEESYLTLQQRLKKIPGFQSWNGQNQLHDRMELIERWYSLLSSGEAVSSGELVLQNIIAANDSVLLGKAVDGSIFGSKLLVEQMSSIFEDSQFSAFNALLNGELIKDERLTENDHNRGGMGVYAALNQQLGFQGMFDENCPGLAMVQHATQICNQTPQAPNFQQFYLQQQQPDIFQGINSDLMFNIMQCSPQKQTSPAIEELDMQQYDNEIQENFAQNRSVFNSNSFVEQKTKVDENVKISGRKDFPLKFRKNSSDICSEDDVSYMEEDGSCASEQDSFQNQQPIKNNEKQSQKQNKLLDDKKNKLSINLDSIQNDFLEIFNQTQSLTNMQIDDEILQPHNSNYENVKSPNFGISNAIRGICRIHPYDTFILDQNIANDDYQIFGEQKELTEEIESALDQIDAQVLPPFEILFQNVVIDPIFKHAATINQNFVLMMLYGKGKGILFLQSLKNSLLMQSGTIQTWASSIFERLNSGMKVQELPQLELNVYLRSLVRASTAQERASLPDVDCLRCEIDNMQMQSNTSEQGNLLKRLIGRKSTEVKGIKLVIKKIDWPVCILIQTEQLSNYNRCFHYLMAIAWTTHAVERATNQLVRFGLVCQRSRRSQHVNKQTELMDVDMPDENSQVDNFEVPKWMYSEMRVALNFCESLSSIIHYHIIPSQWTNFMQNLESSDCIEDVIKVHGDFIRKVLNELCLVQNEGSGQQHKNSKHGDLVRKAIIRGLDLCLQVSGIVNCLLNSISPFTASNRSSSSLQLVQMCQQSMNQFRDHLRYIVRLLTDVAFILEKKPLAELALKLNLNDYYKI